MAENPPSHPQYLLLQKQSYFSLRGNPIAKPFLHPLVPRDGCSPGQRIMNGSFYPEAADPSSSPVRPWPGSVSPGPSGPEPGSLSLGLRVS